MLSKHAKAQIHRLGVTIQEVVAKVREHPNYGNMPIGRTYILIKRLPGVLTLPADKTTSTEWKEVQGNTIKAVYLRRNEMDNGLVTTVMLGFFDKEDRDQYRRKGK